MPILMWEFDCPYADKFCGLDEFGVCVSIFGWQSRVAWWSIQTNAAFYQFFAKTRGTSQIE